MFFNFLTFLNPLSHMSAGHYSSFLSILFDTMLKGLGAKIFSVTAFIIAFWSLFRRENMQAFVMLLLVSLFFAYFSGIFGGIF